MRRVFAALVLGPLSFALLSACGEAPYAADLSDEEYELEAMSLQEEDLPPGYSRQQSGAFDNEEFAGLFPVDDTDAKKRQLDAQGRIRNYVAIFAWENPVEHFGRPLTFTVQSTLYVDVDAAKEAMQNTCGLLMGDDTPVEDFFVPKIGDRGVGFRYSEPQEVIGDAVELNVCFRTGRIVHAVVQSGLDGTQDIALSVRLAQRMLKRVDAAFAGDASESESDGG